MAGEIGAEMLEGLFADTALGSEIAASAGADAEVSYEAIANTLADNNISMVGVDGVTTSIDDFVMVEGGGETELIDPADGYDGLGEGAEPVEGGDGANAGGNGDAGGNVGDGGAAGGDNAPKVDSEAIVKDVITKPESNTKWLVTQVTSALIMGSVMIGLTKLIALIDKKIEGDPVAAAAAAAAGLEKKKKLVQRSNDGITACTEISNEWHAWLNAHLKDKDSYGSQLVLGVKISYYEIFVRGMMDTDVYKSRCKTALLKAKIDKDTFDDDLKKLNLINVATRDWARAMNKLAENLSGPEFKPMTDPNNGSTALKLHLDELKVILEAYKDAA